jgi:tetratricopeptide (TPR) repeat protein
MIRLLVALVLCTARVAAQDSAAVWNEARTFERQLKEEEALAKYRQLAAGSNPSLNALVKCVELDYSLGYRQPQRKDQTRYYEEAKAFADRAVVLFSNTADANYAMALAQTAKATVEEENKLAAQDIRDVKTYADKALAINPNHARANYLLGRWHFDGVNMGFAKKAMAKTIYGGLPPVSLDSAIAYYEKCRSLDEYYVANYLELAKAYQQANKPTKVREVLMKLVRLPNRTGNDVAWKEEGKRLLANFQ